MIKSAVAQVACLLALASLALAQNCSTCTSTSCFGFAYQLCMNGTYSYNGSSICYSTSDCSSYSKADGDFTVTLSGQPPNVISLYYTVIKTAIVTAYNNYCKTNNNYMICCPNAISWPNQTTDPNKTAMGSNDEVNILSSRGDSSQTVLSIRLAPLQNSALCSAVTYATTVAAATTTVASTGTTRANTATAAATTAAAAATGTAATGAATTAAAAATGTAATGAATTAAAAAGTTAPATAAMTGTAPPATSAMTGTAGTTVPSAGVTSPIGRRKREVDFDSLMAEEKAENHELSFLERSRRSTILSLPVSSISSIASGIQISAVIQTALANSNITVTVTVVTVGATTQSIASQIESSRLTMAAAALLTTFIFSLQRRV